MDLTDLPSDFSIQQMREAESMGWKGGENFFDGLWLPHSPLLLSFSCDSLYTGKHDDFCFVCGGTMELFPCQTCENCYHADCMSPTLPPDEVPGFWFCPHCVDRELHIPPNSPTTHYFTPVSPAPPLLSPTSTVSTKMTGQGGANAASNSANLLKRPAATSKAGEQLRSTQLQVNSGGDPRGPAPPHPSEPPAQKGFHKGNNSRQRRSYSPPRKKSKYSAFSSDVDKALTVIHKELEKAAHMGRAEGGLQDKIQALEQQLKLKDGQIQLGIKELEFMRRQHGESSLLEAENRRLKEENAKLISLVESKDAELRDWRAKLRAMIGNDLN
jgi:PHD-finger